MISCEDHDTLLLKESQEDFQLYPAVLRWLLQDKTSPMYLRECPLEGVHSKWLEQRWLLMKRLILKNCSLTGRTWMTMGYGLNWGC